VIIAIYPLDRKRELS